MWNHPAETVWAMTPRQAHAFVMLGLDRERMERAIRLADAASAARGEGRDIERTVKELSGGA